MYLQIEGMTSHFVIRFFLTFLIENRLKIGHHLKVMMQFKLIKWDIVWGFLNTVYASQEPIKSQKEIIIKIESYLKSFKADI